MYLVHGLTAHELGSTQTIETTDYLIAILGVLILLLLLPLINRIISRLYRAIEGWYHARYRVFRVHTMEFVLPTRFTRSLIILTRYLRLLINLALVLVGLTFIFNIFPETHGFVRTLRERVAEILGGFLDDILAYLPSLLAIVAIIVVTRYILKFLNFLSDGIKQEKIKVSGIHPDLIDPTFHLLRILVIALALVSVYPYIPGSDSPVFRGVTIFVGFLLSLGSTSLVANVVSGVVLTYTRGLRVGDRVEIAEVVGDVVDRNLLVTRIKTIKNVIVTIPNAKVLNNHITNYSAISEESGLILNTTVTIGYDAPWRQVHRLLTGAADATPGVLKDPEPFVFQTSLDDYYVSYELNAYTDQPLRMAEIYSELHQNIQDKFNESGIEIMSPAYSALRDGNRRAASQKHGAPVYFTDVLRGLSPEDTRPLR